MNQIGDIVLIVSNDWTEKNHCPEMGPIGKYGVITSFIEKDFYSRHNIEPYKMTAAEITLEDGTTKQIIGAPIDKEDYFSKDEFLAEIGKEIGQNAAKIKQLKADNRKRSKDAKVIGWSNPNAVELLKILTKYAKQEIKKLEDKQDKLVRLEKMIESDPKLESKEKVWEPVSKKIEKVREKTEIER